jgi:hypothetical protein
VELSQEEWDTLAQKKLDELGLTRKELERRIKDGDYTAKEFKVYMLVHPSTIK